MDSSGNRNLPEPTPPLGAAPADMPRDESPEPAVDSRGATADSSTDPGDSIPDDSIPDDSNPDDSIPELPATNLAKPPSQLGISFTTPADALAEVMAERLGSAEAPIDHRTEPVGDDRFTVPPARWNLKSLVLRIGFVLIILAVAGLAVDYGLQLRRAEWDNTESIRYFNDVTNGFGWGKIANEVGLFNVYDQVAAGRLDGPNELDYTPLRLTIVSLWGSWSQKWFPSIGGWRNDYELTRPMLMANTTAEILSSILVFLLIRLWIIRNDDASAAYLHPREEAAEKGDRQKSPTTATATVARSPLAPARPFRGVIRGLIGALLLWFNPCVLIDGHGFPQWDVWNMPFYLAGVLLACTNWWFAAGCCIVVGAFLKGQVLLVAPIFLIWPICRLQFDAAFRFISGFILAAALLAFPWMHPGHGALAWYLLAIVGLALSIPWTMRMKLGYGVVGAMMLAAVILVWPWTSTAPLATRLWGPIILALVCGTRFMPSRLLPPVYATAVGMLIFMLMPVYGVSSAWYTQGFVHGTEKMIWMATRDTYSIPWMMVTYFRWSNDPMVPVDLTSLKPTFAGASLLGVDLINWQPSVRSLMLTIYGCCLALCGIGAAMHSRRNDSRFLVAITAPWLCWFVLITQLNNRYMIWAAGISALFVGVGLGMTLLGIIVSIIGWVGIAQIMTWSGGDPVLASWTRPLTPHLGWALLLAAAIYLWVAIAPRRPRMRAPECQGDAANTADARY